MTDISGQAREEAISEAVRALASYHDRNSKPNAARLAAALDAMIDLVDRAASLNPEPSEDERVARYLAMVSPLGYAAAFNVVHAMTHMLQAENAANILRGEPSEAEVEAAAEAIYVGDGSWSWTWAELVEGWRQLGDPDYPHLVVKMREQARTALTAAHNARKEGQK